MADSQLLKPLEDRAWAEALLRRRWGSERILTRGRPHYPATLPGWVAWREGRPVGLATYRLEGHEVELVTLDSLAEGQGVGTALLEAVVASARQAGCRRIWLITTNDNLRALGFYQRRGWELAALHRGAVSEARCSKPEIPLVGENGIPLRDELELELTLPS